MTRPPVRRPPASGARVTPAVLSAMLGAAALAALAALAGAQAPAPGAPLAPGCAQETQFQDGCQTAADLFTFLAPQFGAALAGGSATLGQAGISGGFGHVSFAFRYSGVRTQVADLAESPPVAGAASPRTIPVRDQLVTMPQVDLSIGILRGVPYGLTNVGGVDLLLSGTWLPDLETDEVDVQAPGSGFRVGYGARLTLLQESYAMPSISVSYMRHDTPRMRVAARAGGAVDSVSVSRLRLRTDSWRVMGGKSFYNFGVGAGIGQDRIDAAGDLGVVLRDGDAAARTSSPIPYEHDVTRTNAFVDLTVAVGRSRLVLELGRAWGGNAGTYNRFAGTSADGARAYGSIGLRTGF